MASKLKGLLALHKSFHNLVGLHQTHQYFFTNFAKLCKQKRYDDIVKWHEQRKEVIPSQLHVDAIFEFQGAFKETCHSLFDQSAPLVWINTRDIKTQGDHIFADFEPQNNLGPCQKISFYDCSLSQFRRGSAMDTYLKRNAIQDVMAQGRVAPQTIPNVPNHVWKRMFITFLRSHYGWNLKCTFSKTPTTSS